VRRDRLRQRLSDLKRCRSGPFAVSKSLLNSGIAWFSIRPLRTNTVSFPRATLSILKVIDPLA
jgi:hypothetical protein